MNDLPDPAQNAGGSPPHNQTPNAGSSAPVGSMNKEVGPGGGLEVGLRDATGQEIELPKEVASAGVRVHPTTVPIPPPVAQMGVKPTGHNIPVTTTSSVVLPISDDQIAKGLAQSVTSSWLWLAQWCIKRLKRLHMTVATVNGKTVRVKAQ